MRAIFVASLLLAASAAQAQTPGVVLEVTSTPAAGPPAQLPLTQCLRLDRLAGHEVPSHMGYACSVPVREGVTYFNVILENATGNQFQVTIEPRSTPPEIRTITPVKRPMATTYSPVVYPLTYPLTPSGDTAHRRLHLDETLDFPVPDAASVVHVTFRWDPKSRDSSLVNAPPPLSGATRDWPSSETELRFENPKIVFPDPVKENPRNIQYSFIIRAVLSDLRWVYLTGLGRFVFSLTPHPELGFQLAGEVQRDTIRVALGDLRFDVTSSRPLLDSPEAFRLYVRVEPSFPAPTTERLPAMGSTSLEKLKPLPY